MIIEYLQQHVLMTALVSYLLGLIIGLSWRMRVRITYEKATEPT